MYLNEMRSLQHDIQLNFFPFLFASLKEFHVLIRDQWHEIGGVQEVTANLRRNYSIKNFIYYIFMRKSHKTTAQIIIITNNANNNKRKGK